MTEARHLYYYRKSNYCHLTDTENNPKYTLDIQNILEPGLLKKTGALFQIPCPEVQQVCNRVVSVSVCLCVIHIYHTHHTL